jgi:hypothetical protein
MGWLDSVWESVVSPGGAEEKAALQALRQTGVTTPSTAGEGLIDLGRLAASEGDPGATAAVALDQIVEGREPSRVEEAGAAAGKVVQGATHVALGVWDGIKDALWDVVVVVFAALLFLLLAMALYHKATT